MKFGRQVLSLLALPVIALGIGQEPTLTFGANDAGLQLGGSGLGPQIRLDNRDWPGVIRAARDLATDFGRVTGTNGNVQLTTGGTSPGANAVIIAGTIGKSPLIDGLASAGKIDVSGIRGKWESFSSQLV